MSVVRRNLKEAGCGEHTNPRANLRSDEQKPHRRLYAGVRLQSKSKPDNYTELHVVDAADGWRERTREYPGRSARYAPKGVTVTAR